jgi:hypothetical protein
VNARVAQGRTESTQVGYGMVPPDDKLIVEESKKRSGLRLTFSACPMRWGMSLVRKLDADLRMAPPK